MRGDFEAVKNFLDCKFRISGWGRGGNVWDVYIKFERSPRAFNFQFLMIYFIKPMTCVTES